MSRRAALSLLVLGVGCASSPTEAAPAAVPSPTPQALAQFENTEDLVDLALLASGYEDETRRARARGVLETKLAELTRPLAQIKDETERARRLLYSLHMKGSLLGTYSARATSLADILERRHYNCVSASVLYNLAAHRLDLTVGAELLPTHARSLLSVREQGRLRRVIVETTAAQGFDPTTQQQLAILAQVAAAPQEGARGLVSEDGKIVGTRVLIGTILVNRGSIVQESGDLELAAALFAQGEAIAGDEDMRVVLRDQRAALLAQLASDDLMSNEPERLERAVKTLISARKIEASDPAIVSVIAQNLRAAAERLIELRAKTSEAALLKELKRLEPNLPSSLRSGLQAFAWSVVSQLRFQKNQAEASIQAMEKALSYPLTAEDAALKDVLQKNHVSSVRVVALEQARRGDWVNAQAYLKQMKALPAALPRYYDEDLVRAAHLVGNYRVEARDYAGAAEIYRFILAREPHDKPAQNNMVAVLQRLLRPMLEAGQCGQLAPLLDELERYEPQSDFARSVRVRCLLERARGDVAERSFASAVLAIREAAKLAPGDKVVEQNLAVSLYAWLQDLSKTGECAQARDVARDLKRVPGRHIKAAQIGRLLSVCRSE